MFMYFLDNMFFLQVYFSVDVLPFQSSFFCSLLLKLHYLPKISHNYILIIHKMLAGCHKIIWTYNVPRLEVYVSLFWSVVHWHPSQLLWAYVLCSWFSFLFQLVLFFFLLTKSYFVSKIISVSQFFIICSSFWCWFYEVIIVIDLCICTLKKN